MRGVPRTTPRGGAGPLGSGPALAPLGFDGLGGGPALAPLGFDGLGGGPALALLGFDGRRPPPEGARGRLAS